jgi:hypothetical protein
MALGGKMYTSIMNYFASAGIDWENDTVSVALLTSSYSPDQDNHYKYSHISDYEIAATGNYTKVSSSGGKTLSNKDLQESLSTNVLKFDADDTTWANLTATFRYAALLKYHAPDVTISPLICYIDFLSNQSPSAQDYVMVWNDTGIFTMHTA